MFPTARAVSAAVFFHDLYSVWGGSDTIVPIDVWIPGCPPTPAATIHGFAVALGLLQQKIHAVDYRDPTGGDYATVVATDPAITAYRH